MICEVVRFFVAPLQKNGITKSAGWFVEVQWSTLGSRAQASGNPSIVYWYITAASNLSFWNVIKKPLTKQLCNTFQ